MKNEPIHVLFLCTRNAARSIMAEACLRALGRAQYVAFSAGTWPTEDGLPDAMTLQVLESVGLPATNLRSKSWEEFSAEGAPRIDIVITLCDAVADEPCPVWAAHPDAVHWSYPDPAMLKGSEQVRLDAYRATLHAIRWRVELLANLPVGKLENFAVAEFAQGLAQVPVRA